MAARAQDLIGKANILLQDVDNVRWSQSELLDWLNEAQLATINLLPSAYSQHRDFPLEAGTRQVLPDDSVRLLDVIRNTDGYYDTAVRVVDRIDLDTQVPGWHTHKAHKVVQHYVYDLASLEFFYIYPPQPEDVLYRGSVEILIGVIPPTLEDVGDYIALKDYYIPALVNYMVFRAYAKDSDSSPNNDLKNQYYDQFLSSLGMQAQANTSAA